MVTNTIEILAIPFAMILVGLIWMILKKYFDK